MLPIASALQMQAIDAQTIQEDGLPGIALMENAGAQISNIVEQALPHNPQASRIAIFCGPGNNGGDGFVVARHLQTANYRVTVYCTQAFQKYNGDAQTQLKVLRATGCEPVVLDESLIPHLPQPDLVIDALLGTGSKGPPRPLFMKIFDWIHLSPAKVISVDIPSGMDPDSGDGPAPKTKSDSTTTSTPNVKADITVTLGALKACCVCQPAIQQAGQVKWVSLGFPKARLYSTPYRLLDWSDAIPWLPKRYPEGYKGTGGKLLIWAGSASMMGAGVLCAKAAVRAGCSMVQLALPADLCPIVSVQHPEIMTLALPTPCHGQNSSKALEPELALQTILARQDWADALIAGPGLGTSSDVSELLLALLPQWSKPALLDADALNILAQHKAMDLIQDRPYVLTPHRGEWQRCFGESPRSGIAHWDFCSSKAKDFQSTIHFKGSPSCTALATGTVLVNETGNEVLSTAGSGDLLSGIIGSFLARGLNPASATSVGALLHGRCADHIQVHYGSQGFDASDIIEVLKKVLNPSHDLETLS